MHHSQHNRLEICRDADGVFGLDSKKGRHQQPNMGDGQ